MKKKKKIIIIASIFLIVACAVTMVALNFLKDTTRLTVYEKQWINDNSNNVVSVNVINDLNVFGHDGKGVYYDFISDLQEEYGLQLNPVVYNSNEVVEGISFGYSIIPNENTFYEDEFVVVGKKDQIFNSINQIQNKKIGVLSEFSDYINNNIITEEKIEYVTKSNSDELIESLNTDEIEYIMVPKNKWLDKILKENLYINFHISDVKIYYNVTNDQTDLANIITKYLTKWKKENLDTSINSNNFELFTDSLNISSSDIDELRSKNYTYGFVNTMPYEIISGGNFGGINAVYLSSFSDFADVKFNFVKYNSINKLEKAISNNKVDIYFDYYNINNKSEVISSDILVSYVVLAKIDNDIVINSINNLKDNEIYIEKDTKLSNYFEKSNYFDFKNYDSSKKIKKIKNDNAILIVEKNNYETLKDNILKDYSVRYENQTDQTYKYNVTSNNVLPKLLNKYIESLNSNTLTYQGLNNYFVTKKSGTIIGTLAKYLIILLLFFSIIIILVYKKSKKIKIAKKIKKEDKMRFIDQLTSLKNRNYLNENLESWNKNTIYPQAVIVLDINKLQDVNDTLGYEQGDLHIQALANVLVKVQLDNSDVIRTDGNEFLIYMVGYENKQVISYIHKLNKEFKKLPFEYGVAISYSMITDDVKSVEDAINEAVESIKTQKEALKEE